MDIIYRELPKNYNPQQNVFKYDDGVVISSNYDSGNLHICERIRENLVIFHFMLKFYLYICPDCFGIRQENSYRTWFNFRVSGAQNMKITFEIKNLNNQINLFNGGYKIVYFKNNSDRDFENSYLKDEEFKWKRLEGNIKARVCIYV